MKARNHEMCSVRSIRTVPRANGANGAKASKSKHAADIPLYHISSCQIKCRRATWFRGSAPCWSCTSHRGQGAKPGTGPAWGASRSVGQLGPEPSTPSSSRRTPYVVPRVSLLGICWPERSNGSTRRPQPPWIPTSCMPPGCNKM
jgi:hypothetical protein